MTEQEKLSPQGLNKVAAGMDASPPNLKIDTLGELTRQASSDAVEELPAVLSATQSNAAEEMVLSSAGSDVAAQQPSSETGREQGDARKHTQGAAEHDKSHNGALAAPKASLLSSSAVKILFGAAILVATAVALWPSTAPTPLAQTTTAGTQPATQPSANAPSGPTEPASPGGGAPPVTVDVGTGGGAELMADVSAAGARLAPADQTCSTLKMTAYDRAVCALEGPERFFECTQATGRRWNAELPGCKIAAPGASSERFNQGSLAGLEDVLMLNRTSLLVLAGAPDSVLAEALHRDILADITLVGGPTRGSSTPLDISTRLSLAPFLISPEEAAAARVARLDERIPSRLRCPMQAGRQKNPNGSGALDIDSPAEIFLDQCAGNSLNPTGDARPYINSIRTAVAMIRADVQRASRLGMALDIQAGQAGGKFRSQGIYAEEDYRARRMAEGVALPFYRFSIPAKGQRNMVQKIETAEDGTMQFCSDVDESLSGFIGATRDNLAMSSAFRMPGDTASACLRFEGYAGTDIPRSILVKDYDQLVKARIDAHAVMLLTAPTLVSTVESATESGLGIGAVVAQPSGFQLFDARQMRALGPLIPAKDSGSILVGGAGRINQ